MENKINFNLNTNKKKKTNLKHKKGVLKNTNIRQTQFYINFTIKI